MAHDLRGLNPPRHFLRDVELLGARPGDHLRLVKNDESRRPQPMLGVLARKIGFTQAHLDDIRKDMGAAVGDDITR